MKLGDKEKIHPAKETSGIAVESQKKEADSPRKQILPEFYRSLSTFKGVIRGADQNSEVKREREVENFIKEKISARRCVQMRRAAKQPPYREANEQYCECGNLMEKHDPKLVRELGDADTQWDWNSCTEPFPTNAFGEIQFSGMNTDNSHITAKYVRVDATTDASVVYELMTSHWKMVPPQLIIHVTGGATNQLRNINQKAIHRFNKGFTRAVDKAKAWVLTGGTHVGVMKMVGDAVAYHRVIKPEREITCIGVATWGIVNLNENLIGKREQQEIDDRFDPDYNTTEEDEGLWPGNYEILPNVESGFASLDPNHTHFLLVDRGEGRGKYGADVSFANEIESYILKQALADATTDDDDTDTPSIPSVLLVLEGGANTIATVVHAVNSNQPVVCITGLGGAADVIAAAYNSTRPNSRGDKNKSDLPADFYNWVKQHPGFRRLTQFCDDDKTADMIAGIIGCLEHRELITVIDITNPHSPALDQTILEAIFNKESAAAEHHRAKDQGLLTLALQWGQCDMAKKYIFTQANLAEPDFLNGIKLSYVMKKAVKMDLTDFVKLFNAIGLPTNRWLTPDILADLYYRAIKRKKTAQTDRSMANLLEKLVQKERSLSEMHLETMSGTQKFNKHELLLCFGKVLSNLLGHHFHNPYKTLARKHIATKKENVRLQRKFEKGPAGNAPPSRGADRFKKVARVVGKFSILGKDARLQELEGYDNPLAVRDLFLFCLVLNRQQMALHFWKQGSDFVGSALQACKLLKALAKQARDAEENDIAMQLDSNADEWEDRAMSLVNYCYGWDTDRTNQLLLRCLPHWDFMTPLNIANGAQCMKFMAMPACQGLLNVIWTGNMAMYTSNLLVFTSVVCPFFIPLIKFHKPPLKHIQRGNAVGPGPVQDKKESGRQPLMSVGWTTNPEKRTIGIFEAVLDFYRAPCTKYATHAIMSNVVFLGMYAYFLLSVLEEQPSIIEYCIWAWMAILAFEELRQLLGDSKLKMRGRFLVWFDDIWNKMDLAAFITLLGAVGTRLTFMLLKPAPHEQLAHEFTIALRCLYAVAYGILVIRQLYNFYAAKSLGPHVLAIGKMLVDLYFFLLIFAVIMFAFNVPLVALMYPNQPIRDPYEVLSVFKRITYDPFWMLFEEYPKDAAEGGTDSATCNNYSAPYNEFEPCLQQNPLSPILLIVYLVITNVMLINMLIAMFTHTFDEVAASSERLWRFYQYDFVYDFHDRPTLPPPLMVINHIYRFLRYLLLKCSGSYNPHQDSDFAKYYGVDHHDSRDPDKLKANIQDSGYRELTQFERHGLDQYFDEQRKLDTESSDTRIGETHERAELMTEDIAFIKAHLFPHHEESNEYGEGEDGDSAIVQELPGGLGERMEKMERQLNELISLMKKQ